MTPRYGLQKKPKRCLTKASSPRWAGGGGGGNVWHVKEESESVAARVAAISLDGVAARVYAAALESGEASASEIARRAAVPRTSAAYALGELVGKGIVSEVVKGRAKLFRAVPLAVVFEEVRDSLRSAEALRASAPKKPSPFRSPEAEVLRGPAGFREAWRRIFQSGSTSYTVISDPREFRDYMREHDILEGPHCREGEA